MRKFLFRWLPLMVTLFLTSCVSYKMSTENWVAHQQVHRGDDCSRQALAEQDAAEHWLYDVVPRHRCQIRWYDLGHWITWALFGNDDDGLFGEAPSSPYSCCSTINGQRALCWGVRNPCHNLFFYVMGSAGGCNSGFTILKVSSSGSEFLSYRRHAQSSFGEYDSGFDFSLHGWKPFVGLRLRYNDERISDFYVGWRERGNFGVKFHPWKKI